MKILVAPARYYLEDIGGSANSKALEFMIALAKNGVEVYGVAGKSRIRKKLPHNFKIINLQNDVTSSNAIVEMSKRALFALKCSLFSYKFAKKEKIKLIHHFSRIPVAGPAFPNLLTFVPKSLRPRLIIGPIQPEGIPLYKDKQGFSGWLEYGVEENLWFSIGRRLYMLFYYPLTLMKELSLKSADLVVCINDEVYKIASKYIDKNKLQTISSGIDANYFKPGVKRKSRSNDKIILSVGDLIKRKDTTSLLEAFSKIVTKRKKTRLLVIGDGPEKKNLKILAKKLGVFSKVSFLGRIDYLRLRTYYQKADIFVNTTLYEPFSNTNLEAMASGLPVVTTNGDGVNSNVSEKCGFFIPKKNPNKLAKVLLKLLSDDQLSRSMGRAGRKRVEQIYSWDAVAKQFILNYKKILGDG